MSLDGVAAWRMLFEGKFRQFLAVGPRAWRVLPSPRLDVAQTKGLALVAFRLAKPCGLVAPKCDLGSVWKCVERVRELAPPVTQ